MSLCSCQILMPYNFFILILEIVKSDENAIKCGKIM